MSLPFFAEELLGEGPPRKKAHKNPRVPPTARTCTTFGLNWEYTKNGPCDPTARDDVVTFLGQTVRNHDLEESEERRRVRALEAALEILSANGYYFKKFQRESEDQNTEKKYGESSVSDAEVLDEWYEGLPVKNGDMTIILASHWDWIRIRCSEEASSALVMEKFKPFFSLVRLDHTESVILEETKTEIIENGRLTITKCTGNSSRKEESNPNDSRVSTLFLLKIGEKSVSKCLCTYLNWEMDDTGPTIELFETADEWEGIGFGSLLLDAVEEDFYRTFKEIGVNSDYQRIKFSVCLMFLLAKHLSGSKSEALRTGMVWVRSFGNTLIIELRGLGLEGALACLSNKLGKYQARAHKWAVAE
mmetsp:Transcript_20862/g.51404  ORF Transcript_20862/g.51404 Transcript_20862/m.51404 type:complete len:361 (-) Transcript_20862:77-1159(-)|eukprot:CAMPEP_0174903742 /NCGR_PEP_ID=MMETSP0167-20121228/45258_1 /TAXON_ID=38298 /ORGANISM="Rhodella maculata, Strain CCMP736" /LENGTH=360 /DNA_ID=CAMNT_0016146149 /DNA_START=109 /DNA_END=1191 /DNA_ORIENTATION=+